MILNRRLYNSILLLLISLTNFGQISKYIFDIQSKNGEVDYDKLTNLINLNFGEKNIVLLSEDRHDYTALDSIKSNFIIKLSGKLPITWIFEEMPAAEFRLFVDEQKWSINIDSFTKDGGGKYEYYLREDINNARKSGFYDYVKKIEASGLNNIIAPIDLGTISTHLALFNYAKYTKSLNVERNQKIDQFCDSIVQKYSLEYHSILQTTNDSEDDFYLKNMRIKEFLSELKKNSNFNEIINGWENIFASYYQTRHNLMVYPNEMQQKHLSTKNFFKLNSFRDSVLFSNFNFFLDYKKTWENIVVSFSTYHLLDTRTTTLFKDVLDSSTITFGKLLHKKFNDKISHIAIICNSGNINDGYNINKNFKKSIEYQLSKKYNYAYIDLKNYRKNSFKRISFYMRPTFERFLKLNWEEVLDGIIFVKNCQCDHSGNH